MKNDRLIPGLILVMIGLVILLDNLGYIDFYWGDIFHLWPLFIIVAGVSLVFAHSKSALTTVIKVVVIIGAFLFVILRYGESGPRMDRHDHWFWHHRDHDNDDADDNGNNDDDNDGTVKIGTTTADTTGNKGVVKVSGVHNFQLPYTTDIKTAELNINGGMSSYTISDTSNQLFAANTKEFWGRYELTHSNDNNNYVLNFELNGKKDIDWHGDHNDGNTAIIKLNPNPVWDVNVEAGAADINFDLSKFKVSALKLNGGAASFDVKLGEPLETTNVHVSTGAASVDLRIPKDVACKVSISGFLSSNNLEDIGFKKDDDGDYETPGFAAAKNKILMNVSGGMASFDVHRY
jgi:hypothetical protein